MCYIFQTLNRLLGMCELQEWSDGETIIKKAIRLVNVVHLVTVRYIGLYASMLFCKLSYY